MKSFYTYPTIDEQQAVQFLRTRRYAQPMSQSATDSLGKTLADLSKELTAASVTQGQSVLGFGMGSASGRIRSIMIGRLPPFNLIKGQTMTREQYVALRQRYKIAKSIVNAFNRGNARTILRRARNAILQKDAAYISLRRALTSASFTDKQRDKRRKRMIQKYGSDSNKEEIARKILENLTRAHQAQAQYLAKRADAIAGKIVSKTSSLQQNPWTSKPQAMSAMRELKNKYASAISAIRLTSSTMVGEQIIRSKQFRAVGDIQDEQPQQIQQVVPQQIQQQQIQAKGNFRYTYPDRQLTPQENVLAKQYVDVMAAILEKQIGGGTLLQQEIDEYTRLQQEMVKIGVQTSDLQL